MDWNYVGMHGYAGGFMWLWFLLLLLLVLLLVSWSRNSVKKDKRSDSALDILQKRLARGEIEPEEYERIKQILENR